jgi:hypothetical protein
MHNLPFDALVLVSLVAIVAFLRAFSGFFQDFFTVGEDYWTWTTKSGEVFEDAEVEKIESDEVTIRHRFGVAHIAIDQLSEASHELLEQTQAWSNHLAAEPAKGGIEPFREWSHVA